MGFEREIISKLMENTITCDDGKDPLDEKTYTVGETQYWRRGGKCYSWTASGGRQECTEDEYMKAISGSSTAGSVKPTAPEKDKGSERPSVEKKQKFDKNNPAVLDAGTPFTNEEIKKVLGVDNMDWEIEPAGYGTGYKDYKVTSGGETHIVRRMIGEKPKATKYKAMHAKAAADHGVKHPSKFDSEYTQRKAAMENDPSESDYTQYNGVRDFDHTSWDLDGVSATISRRPQGYGYYLQTEDFDEEFETKQDLINYLEDSRADYIGQDSDNDY